jgi:hypothetical protein
MSEAVGMIRDIVQIYYDVYNMHSQYKEGRKELAMMHALACAIQPLLDYLDKFKEDSLNECSSSDMELIINNCKSIKKHLNEHFYNKDSSRKPKYIFEQLKTFATSKAVR